MLLLKVIRITIAIAVYLAVLPFAVVGFGGIYLARLIKGE